MCLPGESQKLCKTERPGGAVTVFLPVKAAQDAGSGNPGTLQTGDELRLVGVWKQLPRQFCSNQTIVDILSVLLWAGTPMKGGDGRAYGFQPEGQKAVWDSSCQERCIARLQAYKGNEPLSSDRVNYPRWYMPVGYIQGGFLIFPRKARILTKNITYKDMLLWLPSFQHNPVHGRRRPPGAVWFLPLLMIL